MDDYGSEVDRVVLFLESTLDDGNKIRNQHHDDVKLPRVTIPKFHGDYFKWVSFRDLFCTMVKNKITLSEGQKMQMLKTLVDGEAAALIADLTISDANFISAWDRLLDRYDNNRVVVYKHLNKLIMQSASKFEAKSVKKLLDTTDQVLLALQNMGRPIDSWDDWIVIIITQKLSEESRKDWEKRIGDSKNLPEWDQLKKFLGEQFRMLEGLENTNKRDSQKSHEKTEKQVIKSYQSSVNTENCPACQGDHKVFSCSSFKTMEVKQRWEVAKKQKLCFLCLQHHDDKVRCDKQKPCKKCNRNHSTWLHEDRKVENKASTTSPAIVNAHGQIINSSSQGLLATILLLVQNHLGRQFFLRALVDSGSQASMITSKAAALLDMDMVDTANYVNSLGGNTTGRTQIMQLTIQPRFSSKYSLDVSCYVLRKLTEPLPNKDINIDSWEHLKGLKLADPMFNKVGPIDMLLGADVIGEILLPQLVKGPKGTPMAQETSLGWIISGSIDPMYEQRKVRCLVSTLDDQYNNDNFDLSRFWEMEDLHPTRMLTKDEKICEEFYQQTHSKHENGQFIVKIPFKQDGNVSWKLGESRRQCMARFLFLEKRFARDEKLKTDYTKVMQEYLDMGHMNSVTSQDEKLYYIPHHAVIKPGSLTTKTRVVFDASAKTTSGLSLNECMYVGAKQQADLIDILIKWRTYPVVFKADIEKMYRMIKIDKDDQRYHTILWRKDPTEPIGEYQLNTVTFGTAAAPFLATRTLTQIAMDNEDQFPLASAAIRNGFYVDDLIFGCETVEEATHCKNEMVEVLEKSELKLRKWSSNNEEFLKTIPTELTERALQSFEEEEQSSALGLQWHPKTDKFGFSINWNVDDKKLTKRELLSQASKLFDPLGWCAPVVLNAKLIMQDVYNSKIGWDELVTPTIEEKWTQLREEFTYLQKIQIQRWIGFGNHQRIQLHGFSDASEKAYSAVIYSRVCSKQGVYINLIAAKTRVAPIKTKITLPRLELCGAVLLAHLMESVSRALNMEDVEIISWSDSTVALGWLKGEPMRWKTFVANRISEIQATSSTDWRYCPSEDNPADCASRGLMPVELMKHSLWWQGPHWLKQTEDHWPKLQVEVSNEEIRRVVVNVATIQRNELLLGQSTWFKTLRIYAYCRRMKEKSSQVQLSYKEIEAVKSILIKQCQYESFPLEMDKLVNHRQVSARSSLLSLNPFLDDHGIMRVGGRLRNAMVSYNNKHPIILPRSHRITEMIVTQMHADTLHGGPQLMLTLLRKKYWIVNGKRTVTDVYRKCLNCKRFKAETIQQMMGDLPKERVTLERAFLHTGVDYCGPIEVRASKLRGSRLQKGYIAVFVCLGTRATHLELVSDCTTPAFLAAFNRFIARRGLCHTMYSDNGTNFVGAYNKLARQEQDWFHSKNLELANLVMNKGIEWKFIPPGAPNFGGIWERNVRSVKDHLKRTLKTTRLTFEEYGTILCQIEACFNSRPLQPLTTDVENLNALTPGHFLIGDALMAPPQQCLLDINANRNDRWKHIQLLQQHFWNRWNKEYLNQLQQRQKWKKGTEPVHVGDLVLVKDEQLPPKLWLLGRIVEKHPGSDGRVRVVTLRTHKGQLKRPINKICPLLRNDELEEQANGQSFEQLGTESNDEHELEEHDLGPDVQPPKEQKPIERVKLVKTTERSHSYNLRPRNLTMMLTVIFCILLMIGGGSALNMENMVKVTKFQNHAGIYFEELGRAQIVKATWNIYIRFDLLRYKQDIKRLRSIEKDLSDLCMDMDSQSSRSVCEDTIGLINQQLNMIEDLNTILDYNGDEATQQLRKRRSAPLNGIGWIQHELFGVMDSTQAEEIDQHFREIQQDSNYMTQLLRKQTSILDSTVNLMKSSQKEVNKNYDRIEAQIAVLYNETNVVKRRVKVVSIALFTVAFVNRVAQVQEGILDLITDLHQGHVSSHVFSPQQFKEQLEIMRINLPMDNVVPEITHHDIKALYKIIKGSARVTANYIVLDIQFPLVSRNEFQLWHVIPIPTQHDNQQITIIPDAEFLMINLQRNNFYTLKQHDLRTCLRPRERMFLCNLKHPMYTTKSIVSVCERNLLNHQLELDPSCKVELTSKKEFWIGLTTKNQWIYGTIKPKTLNIVCGTTAQQLLVNGSGILEVMPGCEVNQPGLTLIAESIKQTTGNFSYYPLVNLSDAVTRAGSKGESSQLKMINLTLDHSAQLDSLSVQLHELDQQTNAHGYYHIWHSGGHSMLVITISLIIILIWFNRTRILEFITLWITQHETDDVELSNIDQPSPQHDRVDIHHSSDDIQQVHTTINGHEGGRCPFRT